MTVALLVSGLVEDEGLIEEIVDPWRTIVWSSWTVRPSNRRTLVMIVVMMDLSTVVRDGKRWCKQDQRLREGK